MTMRRWSLALLAATCVGALAVGAATATPPERVPLIIDDTEIEGACAFLVGVEIIANKEKVNVLLERPRPHHRQAVWYA